MFYKDKAIRLNQTLLIQDKFAADIKTKTNILNKFSAEQCAKFS